MTIGEWNDFRTYIYRTGLGIKKGEKKTGRKLTHLLLDGGIISVPADREQEFLDKYAAELAKGTDLYVVEMKSEPCFFFMSEFDIKMDRPMNQEELLQFVRVVQSVMAQAFPLETEIDVNVGVSTAPDGRDCVQSGIHMNWRIPVDLNTAWVLRAWLVRELDAKMPTYISAAASASTTGFPLMEPWVLCYDPCVLLDNGLRMIGSKKAEPCPVCKGKDCYKRGKKTTAVGPNAASTAVLTPDDVGHVCATCQSVGRIDKGRPYSLIMVADREGNPIPEAMVYYSDAKNLPDLVKYLSIRCPSTGEEYNNPAEMAFPSEEMAKRLKEAARIDKQTARKKEPSAGKKKQQLDSMTTATDTVAAADDDGPDSKARSEDQARKRQEKRDELVDVPPDDPIYDAISKYILTEFRGAPSASRIKKTAGGDCYIINSRCHFCENKVALSY
jgi:hypothetical protein